MFHLDIYSIGLPVELKRDFHYEVNQESVRATRQLTRTFGENWVIATASPLFQCSWLHQLELETSVAIVHLVKLFYQG